MQTNLGQPNVPKYVYIYIVFTYLYTHIIYMYMIRVNIIYVSALSTL